MTYLEQQHQAAKARAARFESGAVKDLAAFVDQWDYLLARMNDLSRFPRKSVVTIGEIKQLVCRVYEIHILALIGLRRQAKLVRARHIAYYLSRKFTKHSLPQIGRSIGDRDHTTVLHGANKIANLRACDPALDAELAYLEKQLSQGEAE